MTSALSSGLTAHLTEEVENALKDLKKEIFNPG